LKILKKVLFYLVLVIGVSLIALITSVFLFKDKIINQFVREANKHLNTPVEIKKFDVSIFQDFPNISIVLSDVYIEDSHAGEYPLLTADLVAFQLNPIEVWKGEYTVKGLQINNSEVNLKVNARGDSNYSIFKESDSKDEGSISFALKNVDIKKAKVHYIDIKDNRQMTFTSEKLLASIETTNNIYTIEAEGELTTEKIKVNGHNFLAGKSFDVNSDLIFNYDAQSLVVKPSTLQMKQSGFNVQGEYKWKNKNLIDFLVEGRDTDIQTLLSLLPEETAKNFAKYRSKGEVYIKTKIKGEVSSRRSPSLSIDFGFNNATLYHPDFKSKIENATLQGSFASSEMTDGSKAVLVLKNINAKLNGEPFKANLIIQDFNDPDVLCDFNGRVDAASVMDFYPIENLKDVTGSLLANISFEGKIQLLKHKATAQKVSTRGSIELEKINLKYGADEIPVKNLNGTLQFNNNDLAMSNVSSTLGNSDFLVNGFFKNVITFLLFDDQPIGIEADLKSNFLDVDQLFAIAFGKPSEGKQDEKKQEYEFSISRNINLNFNCDVSALRYRRFTGRSLKGDLLVKNYMAVSRNINLKTMGGDLTCSGIVDAKNNKAIDIVSTFKLIDIDLDSVFYVFENFNQDFIEDKHLKGKTTADLNLEFVLNQNLKIFPETLIADISIAIKNGQLNNFEPMQKLSKYIDDDEGLSKLRFSDLKNDIHIEKKVIIIPQMEVRSNVTDLKISGTHTFDQQIDYHVITPLRNKKRINAQEAQNALEEDGNGRTKLFLKITGTTDNYRVSYDTEAVRKKIGSDLKKEVKELKDAFKNKGKQKQKEAELEQDQYFEDW
jgi:hypothetical protein